MMPMSGGKGRSFRPGLRLTCQLADLPTGSP
jgi:hypothetical protein